MDTKKTRKSASKWEQISERTLLEIWGGKMSELRGCRKNTHILLEMAAELEVLGYNYSVLELKTKMHNMTARYRKEKQKVGTTGGSPSEWEFYKEMDVLLAPYKSYNCEDLLVDSINDINSSIMSQPVSSHTISSLPSSVPSPSISVPSPLSTPTVPAISSPPAASSTAAIRKKEGFEKLIKCMEKGMETMQQQNKNTSERLIAIEEEKKDILKAYVGREAEVQKAIIEFLKRS